MKPPMSNTTATAAPAGDPQPDPKKDQTFTFNLASAGHSESVTVDRFGIPVQWFQSNMPNGQGGGVLHYADHVTNEATVKITSGPDLGLPPGVTIEPLPFIIKESDTKVARVRDIANRLNRSEVNANTQWGEADGRLVIMQRSTGKNFYWPEMEEVGKKAVPGSTTDAVPDRPPGIDYTGVVDLDWQWLRNFFLGVICKPKFWAWVLITILVLRGLSR